MKRKNAAATPEAQESGKMTRREKSFSRFFVILLILTLVLSMGFFTYKQFAIERDSAYASLRNSMYSLRSLITFEGSLGDAFIKLRDGETAPVNGVNTYFEELSNVCTYRRWFFGSMHLDKFISSSRVAVYQAIINTITGEVITK